MTDLKFGYDAKRIYNNASGLGNYARQLVWHMASQYPQHQFSLYTPKVRIHTDFGKDLKNVRQVVNDNGFSWYWRSIGINKNLIADQIQLYHGLSHEFPFFVPKTIRKVVTVHDLIWLKLPQLYPVIDRQFYTLKTKHACKSADKIIAISQQTADDLQTFWKIPSAGIEVIYPHLDPVITDEDLKPENNGNYFLYLSSFTPRKNHLFLLNAFALSFKKHNCNLILAGLGGHSLPEIKTLIKQKNLQKRVEVRENINETEKASLIRNCKAFLYPSMLEGFGLPLTEALQLHKPVFCSDLPVFREAAGKAAFFLPDKTEAWSEKLLKIAGNSLVYPDKEVIEKVLEKFDSRLLTGQLMKVYEELIFG